MIIDDFDLLRGAIAPNKTDPPLIVNPDAVLTSSVPRQRFQSIPGNGGQIFQLVCGLEHPEFTPRHVRDTRKLAALLASK